MRNILIVDDGRHLRDLIVRLLGVVAIETTSQQGHIYNIVKPIECGDNLTIGKPDGYWRKFEKQSKKRNLKR